MRKPEKPKRYDLEIYTQPNSEGDWCAMEENENGDWVDRQDYFSLWAYVTHLEQRESREGKLREALEDVAKTADLVYIALEKVETEDERYYALGPVWYEKLSDKLAALRRTRSPSAQPSDKCPVHGWNREELAQWKALNPFKPPINPTCDFCNPQAQPSEAEARLELAGLTPEQRKVYQDNIEALLRAQPSECPHDPMENAASVTGWACIHCLKIMPRPQSQPTGKPIQRYEPEDFGGRPVDHGTYVLYADVNGLEAQLAQAVAEKEALRVTLAGPDERAALLRWGNRVEKERDEAVLAGQIFENSYKQALAEVERLKAEHSDWRRCAEEAKENCRKAYHQAQQERDEAVALAELRRKALETISKGNCICGMCEVCALGLHGFAKQALTLPAPEALKRLRMEAVEKTYLEIRNDYFLGLRDGLSPDASATAAFEQDFAALVAKLEKGE